MNYENALLKTIKIGIFLALFTPLILGPFGMTFSAYPKAVFFRTIVEIIFILYLLLILLNSRYLFKISPLVLAVFVFLVMLFLSGLLGFNFQRSFFGELERGEGIILYLHLTLFFLILISIFDKKEEWFRLLKLTLIISAISSLAGILQKLNVYSFYGIDKPRVSGTLVNPDFFGAYIVLAIFVGIFVLLTEKNKKWKIVWSAILILNFYTLILSGTRAAWLGMGAGIVFIFSFWLFYYSKLRPKLRKIILFIAFIFVLFVLLIVLNQGKPFIRNNYFLSRAVSLLDIRTVYSRLLVWEVAFDAWKEKPILGWGPESFSYIFDKSFEADKHRLILREFFFDRPHNKIMGLMASSGILGLLSYLSIFAAAFYILFKRYSGTSRLVLIALLIAYFVQNLFTFDTISTYLIFFLVLGFVNNLSSHPAERGSGDGERKKLTSFKIIFIVSLILLSLIALYQVNLKLTLAGLTIIEGGKMESKDFNKALSYYKKGISQNTIFAQDFRVEVIARLIIILEGGWAKESEKEMITMLSDLKPFLEKQLEKPDIRYRNFYELLARINERIYLFSGDPEALIAMEEVSRKALEFNDQRSQFYQLLGKVKIFQKNYQKGEAFFEIAFELTPRQLEDRINYYKDLGVAYFKAGDKPKAAENFKKSIDLKYLMFKLFSKKAPSKKEAIFMEKVARIYYFDLNDLETSQEIYEKAMEMYPQYQKELQFHLEQMFKTRF